MPYTMKQLIINADDFGADPARNRGIIEGLEAGVVTSVSILANGPALVHLRRCVPALIRRRISCGLHLNLSKADLCRQRYPC
jgi:predicted glycoside hydrolase/deacetylase ChbG (UPF0249 family)